jgi:hypothetical protein
MTLSGNLRRVIEERPTMFQQKGNKPAGYTPAIFGACGTPS